MTGKVAVREAVDGKDWVADRKEGDHKDLARHNFNALAILGVPVSHSFLFVAHVPPTLIVACCRAFIQHLVLPRTSLSSQAGESVELIRAYAFGTLYCLSCCIAHVLAYVLRRWRTLEMV